MNRDLLDFYRGRMSIRTLAVLVRGLLEDRSSALLRAIAPDAVAWTPEGYIFANLYDLLSSEQAKPYPRPGDVEREEARRVARHTALERQAQRIRARGAT